MRSSSRQLNGLGGSYSSSSSSTKELEFVVWFDGRGGLVAVQMMDDESGLRMAS